MQTDRIFTPKTDNWSRYSNIYAALILALILVLFYRDVVFSGRTFLIESAAQGTMPVGGPFKYKGVTPGFVANDPGAIAWQIEPFNRFLSKSIKRGDFPLWNPYAGLAGNPLLADGHTGPLEPLQFLFFFIPDRYWTYAIDAQLLLRFFLAGFFSYLFARRLKIGFLGGIAAGVVFMLSSYFVTHGNHPQVKTETLLPLVLYGYDRLTDFEDRQGFWLCALSIGWALIAAMPESTFFALFLGTLWYFYKSIFAQKENNVLLKEAGLISIRFISATVLGFLISAAYLLPFLEYVSLSASVHSTNNGINWGGRAAPVWAIISTILPVKGRYFVQFGIFSLFVLVSSLLSFRDRSKFRPAIIFFGLYAVFFILAVFNFPLVAWVQEMPVFNQIALQRYPVLSIAFCLALLAGIFVEEAGARLSCAKVSVALIILPLFFLVLPRMYDPENFLSNLPTHQVMYMALYFFGGLSLTLYLFTFLRKRSLLKSYTVQVIMLLMLVVEPFFWGAQIKRPSRYDPFFQHIPPFIHFLKNDNQIYRIFSMGGILYPNISTAYEIFDVRWLDPLMPQRTYDFTVRFVNAKQPETMRLTGTSYPISDEMFNVLNVKYVLDRSTGICKKNPSDESTLKQPIFSAHEPQGLHVNQLFINNSARNVIVAHPPNTFDMVLTVPEQPSSLDVSIGLNPLVFQPDRGDGVDFTIKVLDENNEFTLLTRYMDPKNDPCARKWFDESILLNQWAGKEITLRFSTSAGPAKNNDWDWAYWGDIQLNTSPEVQPSGQQPQDPGTVLSYEMVHRDSYVEIFENKEVYSRAFVVYDIVDASSFNQAMDMLANPDLDLRETAVVENFPDDARLAIHRNRPDILSASAHVKRITPDHLEAEVETDAPGLLVVSEQYYPGWQAYVDGKETTIYAVDGILRGVFLNEGKHTVRFEYRPLSYLVGSIISGISFLVTLVFLLYFHKRPLGVETLDSRDPTPGL